MKTSVELTGMIFQACHGVSEQERRVGNRFSVSVKLCYPFEQAAYNDDISATLNYAEVYDVVKSEMAVHSCLIEHVACRIKDALLRRFPEIDGGVITVAKLCPPIPGAVLDSASVTIEW